MRVVLYLSAKEREQKIGEALTNGFEKHGEKVITLRTEDFQEPRGDTQVAVMVGVKGHSKKIFESHRRAGRHTMLIDKAYFDRGDYYRVILDGFQPAYAHDVRHSASRLETFKVSLKPLRAEGKHYIYAGSSQKYCDWHDLGDASVFADSVCTTINKRTHGALPVYYRPKPSWAAMHPDEVRQIKNTIFSPPQDSLANLLPNCHALVTHGSNAGLEAIAAGVPVVLVSKEGASAVWSLAEKDITNGLVNPFWPGDDLRRQIFADLAWCQFSLEEMAAGMAWESLLPYTVKGLSGAENMSEGERTIALYRIMHRGRKMFRGNSIKGHTEAITSLVEKHKPQNLLDYGSGKGLQYEELKLHERWGGLRPHCYDPGYAPLADKPAGKFDGVICTDVAEHIPEQDVGGFLEDVIGYANKFSFFCIFTDPSSKFLPDGRNCHLTVRPAEWWLDRICSTTGGKRVGDHMVEKQTPDGPKQFKHYVIAAESGPEVVVTFRSAD